MANEVIHIAVADGELRQRGEACDYSIEHVAIKQASDRRSARARATEGSVMRGSSKSSDLSDVRSYWHSKLYMLSS